MWETAHFILFSAKTQIYKQNTHIRKVELKLFFSSLFDYYKTVFSFLSQGNDYWSLSDSRTISQNTNVSSVVLLS